MDADDKKSSIKKRHGATLECKRPRWAGAAGCPSSTAGRKDRMPLMIFTASGMMKREMEMLHIIERIAETAKVAALLTLPFELRLLCCLCVWFVVGCVVVLLLPRGFVLCF